MLIQKLRCPHGCENAVFSESVKILKSSPSNLLMENGGANQITEKVIVHTCNCCGNTFETKEKNDGRVIL